MKYQPECKFCHRVIMNVDNKMFHSQEEANEYGTLNCNCETAKDNLNKLKSINKLNEYIDNLEHSFQDNSIELSDEIREMLKKIGMHVLKYDCAISYNYPPLKISFSLNKNENLIINTVFTESKKAQI
jgi:hypothetical protein|nr:MAG TPA: hypothetical protein [Caudoviricetes sp.]